MTDNPNPEMDTEQPSDPCFICGDERCFLDEDSNGHFHWYCIALTSGITREDAETLVDGILLPRTPALELTGGPTVIAGVPAKECRGDCSLGNESGCNCLDAEEWPAGGPTGEGLTAARAGRIAMDNGDSQCGGCNAIVGAFAALEDGTYPSPTPDTVLGDAAKKMSERIYTQAEMDSVVDSYEQRVTDTVPEGSVVVSRSDIEHALWTAEEVFDFKSKDCPEWITNLKRLLKGV